MLVKSEAEFLDFLGYDDDFLEATQCYELAIQLYTQLRRRSVAATLNIELAQALQQFGHLEDAAAAFTSASQLLDEVAPPAML